MIDLQNVAIPEDVLGLVPGNVLERYKVLPFEYASDNMNVILPLHVGSFPGCYSLPLHIGSFPG